MEKRLENLKRDAGKKIAQLKESNATLEKTVTVLKEKAKEKIQALKDQLDAKGLIHLPSPMLPPGLNPPPNLFRHRLGGGHSRLANDI